MANKNQKKANLLDHHSIKHILDESVSEIVTSRGYVEDFRTSNIRLLIGIIIIVIALVAQFYKKKFPENRDFLIACIVLYPLKRFFFFNLIILFASHTFIDWVLIFLRWMIARSCKLVSVCLSVVGRWFFLFEFYLMNYQLLWGEDIRFFAHMSSSRSTCQFHSQNDIDCEIWNYISGKRVFFYRPLFSSSPLNVKVAVIWANPNSGFG